MFRKTFQTAWRWIDDRLGLSAQAVPLLRHRVPPDARWWYVFGSATLAAFMVQVVTGVALAFSYVPASGEAYASLQYLTHQAPLGRFLRGLHYFGASAMVLMVGVHAIQVFLFGAYKFPRELNWMTGVALLGITVGMGFTGQLLRWDQTAVWSVVVGAEQAGRAPWAGPWLARFILAGDSIGGATLTRFFAIHTFVLPALILGTIGAHLQLVLRNGVSEPPQPGVPVEPRTYRRDYEALLEKKGVPFWPDAAWRDIVFGVAVVVAIVLLAVFSSPPELGKPPDPSIFEADPRPDWYLLWYFALLALLPHGLERTVIVYGPPLAFGALLLLPLLFPAGERHVARRPWAVAGVLGVVVMIGSFWRAGVRSDWAPDLAATRPAPAAISSRPGQEEGAQLFRSKACAACHMVDGAGGRRGPDLTDVSKRLMREQMTLRILNGGVNMPAYSHILTPQELEALIDYFESNSLSPSPQQQPQRGWQIKK